MEHDKKLIEKIAIEVQTEYQMGGLAEGVYLDFATDVAIRYANAVLKQADVSGSLPTLQEIKTSLYKCAKVTIESDGVKMERLFEKEAKAMLALFGGNDL